MDGRINCVERREKHPERGTEIEIESNREEKKVASYRHGIHVHAHLPYTRALIHTYS